jgi:hypothetical protein
VTGRATRLLHRGVAAVSVGLLVMAAMVLTATPAVAKHHTRKPHKLWSQYPLNVERPTPAVTPSKAGSQRPAATPSSANSPGGSSDRTDGRSAHAGLSGRTFALFVVGALLLAAVFLVLKRAKPPQNTNSRRARSSVPPDPQAAAPANSAGNGYNRSVVETTSEPWMGAPPARVRLQLEDGRSLEGFTRKSSSTDPELVILDVVATFDPNGKEAPPRPSDSFILRSEIASMQRIEDS